MVELQLPYNRASARVRLPSGVDGYAAQSLHEWGWHRWAEIFLFGDGPIPPACVSAHIGACTLGAVAPTPYAVVVYPVIRIYETGVILVQLRMFGPRHPVLLAEFIDDYVNAPLAEFRWATVPPGVSAWAPLATREADRLERFRGPFDLLRQSQRQRAIVQRTRADNQSDFTFQQAPLSAALDDRAVSDAVSPTLPELQQIGREAMIARARQLGVPEEVVGMLREATEAGSRDPSPETGARDEDTKAADQLDPYFDLAAIENELTRAAEAAMREAVPRLTTESISRLAYTPETFHGLALTLMRVTGFVAATRASGPRKGLALMAFGRGRFNEIGNHWVGRPHVHLVRFKGQAATASTNERLFAAELGQIMAKTSLSDAAIAREFLPKSSRRLDDVGEYTNEGIMLWVHSREGLSIRGSGSPDPNRDRLVHEQQVKAEVLEYGYALHRRIAEQALDPHALMPQLLRAERDLSDFEWALQDTGKFGEVRDLLAEGLAKLRIPELRTRIADALRIRRDIASEARNIASARWTTVIALVAGFLAVPTIADAIVQPLWHHSALPHPADADVFRLGRVGVATAMTSVALSIGFLWSRHTVRSRNAGR